MKKNLKLPKFKNEDQERNFWSKLNLSEYFEPSDFQANPFTNLKPTSQPISIRLPKYIVDGLKQQANSIDIPYQSLIKTILSRHLFGRP